MKTLALNLGLGSCVALSGCGGKTAKAVAVRIGQPRTLPSATSPPPNLSPNLSGAKTDWRRVATPADRDRLRTWRDAWVAALARVRASGKGGAIAAQGPLFDPDRSLDGATPPPGHYRCRVFKLGANGSAMQDFTAYPSVDCRVDDEGEVSSLYKVGGAQRPVGLLFDDSGTRTVFLGTMVFGDETKPLDYGQDAGRDMAGYIERVGERRWRLVLPYPRFESLLDVVELVPAEPARHR